MMNASTLTRHFGNKQRIRILDLIKHNDACSVRELAEDLQLSYMGTKQHCQTLEKEGFLTTWRRPRQGVVGRPELAYRLTSKAESFFPAAVNPLALEILSAAAGLYGQLAPEKLLLCYYEQLKHRYQARVRGTDLKERIEWVRKLRDADGYMARIDDTAPFTVVEKHSPVADLLAVYPCVARFEEELYSDLTGTACRRLQDESKTSYHCEFHCTAIPT